VIIQVASLLRKRHDVQGRVPRCWPSTTRVSISTVLERNSPALTRESEAENLATVTRKLLAGFMRD
jgi:hypothetical protein